MSAHRQDFLKLQQEPLWRDRRDRGGFIWKGYVAFVVVVLGLWAGAQLLLPQQSAQVTPVRTPTAQAFELPPVSPEEARIEGFRAGMATAAEQGCPAATLSAPLATR